jgi:hypothetical protein
MGQNEDTTDPRHRFQLKGSKAEEYVTALATGSFFLDWCFRSPRLPDGSEFCDLLVVFDDTAIIWQVKDLVLDKNGRYRVGEVEKNLRQLRGARRHLQDLKRPITVVNARRGQETLDPLSIKRVFLISALLGEGEDSFALVEASKTPPIHVFTRAFTEIALSELDTISDFVQYLDTKEQFISSSTGRVIVMGGEEQLLAYYLLNERSFGEFVKFELVTVDDDFWNHVQRHPAILARKEADRVSYGWDSFVERAHEGGDVGYEAIARELARPNRFVRRVLAQSFLEAQLLAHNDHEHPIWRRVTTGRDPVPGRNTTYCFLFMDETLPLAERRAMLERMCIVARVAQPENQWVVGIATEKRFGPTCSYDFAALYLPTISEAFRATARSIQEDEGILRSPKLTNFRSFEYPPRPDEESDSGERRT